MTYACTRRCRARSNRTFWAVSVPSRLSRQEVTNGAKKTTGAGRPGLSEERDYREAFTGVSTSFQPFCPISGCSVGQSAPLVTKGGANLHSFRLRGTRREGKVRRIGALTPLSASVIVVGEAGACRDQSAHDNVFLQSPQFIPFAGHGGLCQHPRGLLEGSRRDEGFGGKRCLGNTQQQLYAGRWPLALGGHLVVSSSKRSFSICSPVR